MDNPLILQMLGILMVLFVCFLTYMNTKVWRATHVTFGFLVFAAAIAFSIYASLTLKTHGIWKDQAQKLEALVKAEELKRDLLAEGNPGDENSTAPSVMSLSSDLRRISVDRGRVWWGCTITASDPTGITLSTTPAPQAGVDPAAAPPAKPNNMLQHTVLHVFKEAPAADPAIATKIPAVYLGVYDAVAVTETTVTLSPLLPLDAEQRAEVQDANATWALYESMPVDNHELFAGLTEEQLQQLFPADRVGLAGPEYDRLIKSYARTGTTYQDTDRPEEKWIKVKFLQPHKVAVNSDGAGAVVVDGGAFDADGKAILPSLKRVEGEVEFKPGAVAVFYADDEATRDLVTKGVCELVENLYYRPLNDYGYLFHQRYTKLEEVKLRMTEMNRDLASLKKADAEVLKQITLLTETKTKLDADLKAAKYELASVTKYHGDLETQLVSVRNQCNEFYRTNKKLGQELSEISARLTEEINAKTRAATASTQ